MFTGLIIGTGKLVSKLILKDFAKLTIEYPTNFPPLQLGDSISVNGVCLTISDIDHSSNRFDVDVMGITLSLTNMLDVTDGSIVNLEPAMTIGDRFGGHLVQGHIDGKSQLLDITEHSEWSTFRFSLDSSIAKYVVLKGSICLNGVSLTVSGVGQDWFEVSLIPTTLNLTNFGEMNVGALVNVEVDLIAKYVESMLKDRE